LDSIEDSVVGQKFAPLPITHASAIGVSEISTNPVAPSGSLFDQISLGGGVRHHVGYPAHPLLK
jgi:hypothetical protein